MKKNMGIIDKAIRIAIALLLVILYFTSVIEGTLGIIAWWWRQFFCSLVLLAFVHFTPLVAGVPVLRKSSTHVKTGLGRFFCFIYNFTTGRLKN